MGYEGLDFDDIAGGVSPGFVETLYKKFKADPSSVEAGWRDWFEQAGCDTRRSLEGARFDQYALLSQAAAAGFGVALIPRCLIEDELRDGKLAVAIQLPIRARMGYYLCYPEQKANLPTLQAFRTWLMEVSRAAEPQPQEDALPSDLK